MLYALAIGYLQQIIYPFKRPVRALWLGVLFCGIVYAFLPLTIGNL
jgi:hypothetical protein